MDSDQQATLIQPTAVPHPGEILVDYLEFHAWAQRDLARRTGLTPKTISEICNGKSACYGTDGARLRESASTPCTFLAQSSTAVDEAEARHYELRSPLMVGLGS